VDIVCRVCTQSLPETAFHAGSLKRCNYCCKICRSADSKRKRLPLVERLRLSRDTRDSVLFECGRCKTAVPADQATASADRYICSQCSTIASAKWRDKSPFEAKIVAIRARSKRKGIPFDLTAEWYECVWATQAGRCFYSGVPMTFATNTNDPMSASVDRCVPVLGYVQPNCVLYCTNVNFFKDTLSVEQFKLFIEALYNRQFPLPATKIHLTKAAT
jgi:hypothetical protein